VGDERWRLFERKQEQKTRIAALLSKVRAGTLVGLDATTDNPTLLTWLRRPEAKILQLERWITGQIGADLAHGVLTTIETESKYEGYLAQQTRQIQQLQQSESRLIPESFSYEQIPGLSNEVRQKLTRVRPGTLGQAGRIPGITPAAVAVLDIYLNLGTDVSRETLAC
jgi:tRNA uridine 5-carboxymethylaminomethyl modification enzyme